MTNRSRSSIFSSFTKWFGGGDPLLKDGPALAAVDQALATIRFKPDGTIVTANSNFLAAVGYQLTEIEGQHHRMFVDPVYGSSGEYLEFWASLRRGEAQTAEFQRFAKGGRSIWIQASYTPIRDNKNDVIGVIKVATDITAQKEQSLESAGRMDAIDRSQAVIKFRPDGTIVEANENFYAAMGYTPEQIVGKHHRMFCDKAYGNSDEYQQFWTDLAAGEFQQGEFQRFNAAGEEIWLSATYAPIVDASGKVKNVVKFATDITRQYRERERTSSLGHSIAEGLSDLNTSARDISHRIVECANLADSVAPTICVADWLFFNSSLPRSSFLGLW